MKELIKPKKFPYRIGLSPRSKFVFEYLKSTTELTTLDGFENRLFFYDPTTKKINMELVLDGGNLYIPLDLYLWFTGHCVLSEPAMVQLMSMELYREHQISPDVVRSVRCDQTGGWYANHYRF